MREVVRAMKKQPGFEADAFEAAIRESLRDERLGRPAQAALLCMLEDPWAEQRNEKATDD